MHSLSRQYPSVRGSVSPAVVAVLAVLIAVLWSAPAIAADTDDAAGDGAEAPAPYKIGDTPDDVDVQQWVNTPAWTKFSDLRGDVIIFKRWGLACGPCHPQVKRLAQLDAQFRGKGLHVFGEYAQTQSWDLVRRHMDHYGIKFPVAMDGAFGERFVAPLLCNLWVIGVDGRIIFSGVNGWEEAALAELKKVTYPRLGSLTVPSELTAAATAFGAGQYARARELADAIADTSDDDAVVEAAEQLVARVESMRDELASRAWQAEVLERYDVALAALEELATRFAGVPDGPDATAEADRIRTLERFDPVREARTAFIAARLDAWREFENVAQDDTAALLLATSHAAKILRTFQQAHSGCTVAITAGELAADYEYWNDMLWKEQTDDDSQDESDGE